LHIHRLPFFVQFLFTYLVYINTRDNVLIKQILPCAEKNCKSKMILVDNNNNTIGYSCLENPEEHNFRYNLTKRKWEKILIKTKLILHYNQNPHAEILFEALSQT